MTPFGIVAPTSIVNRREPLALGRDEIDEAAAVGRERDALHGFPRAEARGGIGFGSGGQRHQADQRQRDSLHPSFILY
jgi:hypothetical protein